MKETLFEALARKSVSMTNDEIRQEYNWINLQHLNRLLGEIRSKERRTMAIGEGVAAAKAAHQAAKTASQAMQSAFAEWKLTK